MVCPKLVKESETVQNMPGPRENDRSVRRPVRLAESCEILWGEIKD